VPGAALAAEYRRARDDYTSASEALVPILVRIALDSIDDVLPGAHELALDDRINEDWIPTLRIQRVTDADGRALLDLPFGHIDPLVEDIIDEVNTEYLDLLLDLTGDAYMGGRSIDRDDIEAS